jgi:hypothetical protein
MSSTCCQPWNKIDNTRKRINDLLSWALPRASVQVLLLSLDVGLCIGSGVGAGVGSGVGSGVSAGVGSGIGCGVEA